MISGRDFSLGRTTPWQDECARIHLISAKCRADGVISWISSLSMYVTNFIDQGPHNDVAVKSGQKRILFDAVKDGQSISPKWVPAEEDQELNESRRCVYPFS